MTERPAILGYSPPNPDAAKLSNHFKLIEEAVLRVVEGAKGTDLDQRWLAIAATHFQEGFMALNYANFRPARIEGTIDLSDVTKSAHEMLALRKTNIVAGSVM